MLRPRACLHACIHQHERGDVLRVRPFHNWHTWCEACRFARTDMPVRWTACRGVR